MTNVILDEVVPVTRGTPCWTLVPVLCRVSSQLLGGVLVYQDAQGSRKRHWLSKKSREMKTPTALETNADPWL